MADISVTAASVLKGTPTASQETTPVTSKGTAGATITAGQVLCRNTTTGRMELADANGASAYMKVVAGISLHGAASGQPIEYLTSGYLTFNAVLTAGTAYVMSATAGGIAPASDLASGHTITDLGRATSTTNLFVRIFNSGVAL